jgi:hypothetical protein
VCSARVVADTSAPDSVFSGDFSAVSQISFAIAGTGSRPRYLALMLRCAGTGRLWTYTVDTTAVPLTPGEVATVVVPLKLSAGWVTGGRGDRAAMWAAQIKDIAAIVIQIQPSSEAQSYTLSNLMLDGKTGPALVPQRVLDYFAGKGISGIPYDLDTDGDGMPDYLEVWAGTDPESENSVFAAKIVSVVGQTATVQWPYVADGSYTVVRTDRVGGAFSIVDAKVGSDNPNATVADGKMTYADGTAKEGVAYFYRVTLE